MCLEKVTHPEILLLCAKVFDILVSFYELKYNGPTILTSVVSIRCLNMSGGKQSTLRNRRIFRLTDLVSNTESGYQIR